MRIEDLRRFVVDVPRYTSYPTAADFTAAVDARVHGEHLRAVTSLTSEGLALYVHLPFCRALCHFCGCHAMVARTHERIDRYLSALGGEIALVAAELGAAPIAELHFGGGSPSLLAPADFARLMTELRASFAFEPAPAISLEADPRTTDAEKLACYRRHGVGRISFGFQDLDDDVQHAIGRHQGAAVARAAFEAARAAGFDGINVDLCYGLPLQTDETFARTVEETVALRPDRIALFGYAHVPWLKPQQKRIPIASLPDVELRLSLVAGAHQRLRAAGYDPIGFDHFALPGDPLAAAARAGTLHRNFQGYTATRTAALIGLGLSAISDLPGGYAQNARALPDYLAAVEAGRLPTERGVARSPDDRVRGDIIHDIMCRFRIDPARIARDHGIDLAAAFPRELDELHRLEGEGLVHIEDGVFALSELGRMFVRNVAVVFDAHRPTARAGQAGQPRFSSSV